MITGTCANDQVLTWQTSMAQPGIVGLGNVCKGSGLCPTKADELEGNPKRLKASVLQK